MTTQSIISAPALRGDDPLGFLAAVGVVALGHVGAIPLVRLGWSDGLSPHARFLSESLTDVGKLASSLGDAAAALRDSGGVLPGGPTDVPLSKPGTGKDPSRMRSEDAKLLHDRAGEAWIEGDRWFGRWLTGLFGQTVTDDAGRVRLTPLYAPFGQMSLRTSLYEKSLSAMEAINGPGDALTGWIRTDPVVKYDGANIDQRAKRDGAVTTDGRPTNQGAPSPTWLATAAPLLLPVAESGTRSGAVGWQPVRLRLDEKLTRRSLVWPIWDEFLEGFALQTLLAHPALKIEGQDTAARLKSPDRLSGLGVRAVFGASRSTQSQGDGPLAAATRLWPRDH